MRRLPCPVQELNDGKEDGDPAAGHGDQKDARYVGETEWGDTAPASLGLARPASPLLLPPFHLQIKMSINEITSTGPYRSTFSPIKTINIDFSFVWFLSLYVNL